MRNAMWLLRRAEWLQEVHENEEVVLVRLCGKDMVVDGETKYLPFDTWARHMGFKLGRPDFVLLLKGKAHAPIGVSTAAD